MRAACFELPFDISTMKRKIQKKSPKGFQEIKLNKDKLSIEAKVKRKERDKISEIIQKGRKTEKQTIFKAITVNLYQKNKKVPYYSFNKAVWVIFRWR